MEGDDEKEALTLSRTFWAGIGKVDSSFYDALVRFSIFSIFHQWDCFIKEREHECVAPFGKDQEKNCNFYLSLFFSFVHFFSSFFGFSFFLERTTN